MVMGFILSIFRIQLLISYQKNERERLGRKEGYNLNPTPFLDHYPG